MRRALGDFGVLIAILAMSLLDYIMRDTYTQVSSAGQVHGDFGVLGDFSVLSRRL